jgi:hypothetical protein
LVAKFAVVAIVAVVAVVAMVTLVVIVAIVAIVTGAMDNKIEWIQGRQVIILKGYYTAKC